MTNVEYNNTNRGAMWSAKGFAGKVNISGDDLRVLMIQLKTQNEAMPIYIAVIRNGIKDDVVPIWRPKNKNSKSVGVFTYAEHIVNVFVNDKKTTANSPLLTLSAMPMTKEAPLEHVPETRNAEPDLPF